MPLRDFFVRRFGFRATSDRGDAFVVLEGEDGFVLNLMRANPDRDAGFPRDVHVGCLVDAPATVRAKHAELAAAGSA